LSAGWVGVRFFAKRQLSNVERRPRPAVPEAEDDATTVQQSYEC